MTIYYTLTFLLLASEMLTFCFVVMPLPYAVRKKVFHFLSESAIVAKFAYGLKISFIFIGVLFVDAMQRMFRVTQESEAARTGGSGAIHDVRTETNFAARKFYAQRNVYLTGFTLFLSLVLTRTFYIILDLIHTQEEYAKLKQATSSQSRKDIAAGGNNAELKARIAELEAKERDFETLKKQSKQQAGEYDRLATEHNKATGSISNKRVD